MIDKRLEGPWFNFNEVEKKTGLLANEVLYKIEIEEITAVVYSSNRPFLAVSQKDNETVGHAWLRYAGPVALPQEFIREVIRDGQALAKTSPVQLLQPRSLVEWFTDHPYFGRFPNGIIDRWEPKDYESIRSLDWFAIAFPEELEDYGCAESALTEWIPEYYNSDEFLDRFAEQTIIQSPSSPFYYATHINSDYSHRDLRLPKASVDRILAPPSDKHPEPAPAANPKRINELHLLIAKLIKAYPDARSGALWNILREDCRRDIRRYDQDEVIDLMDNLCIEWTSAAGISQSLKRTSFPTVASKIRKNV